jgi:hypothetical protein
MFCIKGWGGDHMFVKAIVLHFIADVPTTRETLGEPSSFVVVY